MSDLIETLTILLRYGDPKWPTHCEHDTLWIVGIDPDDVSDYDKTRLVDLGFFVDESDNSFKSFRFGSA